MNIRRAYIRIRPYTRQELIDAASVAPVGIIVDNLSIPLSVLIDMGEQKTHDHDPLYMEMYVHDKLIPRSSTDECLSDIAGLEYMVIGHKSGTGCENRDSVHEFAAPEGEVIIQVTGNVEDIVNELESEIESERRDEKRGLHPEHEDATN